VVEKSEQPAKTKSGHHDFPALTTMVQSEFAIDLDSTAFAQSWNVGWKGRTDLRGRVVVGFRVPTRMDVDDVFRDSAGYRGVQEPHDAFLGARYAIIEDPDGIAVGLMSPVSPDKKSQPPNL